MRSIVAALAVACAACSSTSQSGGFKCAIGELTGTWRYHYEMRDGTCGAIADETVSFSAGGSGTCSVAVNNVSADKCSADQDFTCPTNDGKGAQHWTGVMRHTRAEQLSGSFTAEGRHPALGTCRSTYDVTVTKL